jgi:hypothetical protein
MTNQINPQSVIPNYWATDEELALHNLITVKRQIQYWREKEHACDSRISSHQYEINLLNHQAVEEAQCENPVEVGALAKLHVKYCEDERDKAKEERHQAISRVNYLLEAAETAEKKPAPARDRPHSWFEPDDKVMCFVSFDGIACDPGFISGKVVDDHWSRDGRVHVIADEKVHDDGGRDLYYSVSRPEILQEWEFDYLRSHADSLDTWLCAAKNDSQTKLELSDFR